jgi:hypothetical protein
MAKRERAGFTLVESGIVAVIVVIAFVLAILLLQSKPWDARRATPPPQVPRVEVSNMLHDLVSREGMCCTDPRDRHFCDAPYWPPVPPGPRPAAWGTAPGNWRRLGLGDLPWYDGGKAVHFRYSIAAGGPTEAPPIHGGTDHAAPIGDVWWIADAIGDLDGDGVRSTYEMTSFSREMWVRNDGE